MATLAGPNEAMASTLGLYTQEVDPLDDIAFERPDDIPGSAAHRVGDLSANETD
jgi:hypothetical protein